MGNIQLYTRGNKIHHIYIYKGQIKNKNDQIGEVVNSRQILNCQNFLIWL